MEQYKNNNEKIFSIRVVIATFKESKQLTYSHNAIICRSCKNFDNAALFFKNLRPKNR